MRGTVVIAPSESVADLPADLSGQILMRVVSVTQDITPLAVAAAARGAVAVIATRVDVVYPRQASAFAPVLTADVSIPVVGVGQVQKHALLDLQRSAPIELQLTTTLHPTPGGASGLSRTNERRDAAWLERSPVVLRGGSRQRQFLLAGRRDAGAARAGVPLG